MAEFRKVLMVYLILLKVLDNKIQFFYPPNILFLQKCLKKKLKNKNTTDTIKMFLKNKIDK